MILVVSLTAKHIACSKETSEVAGTFETIITALERMMMMMMMMMMYMSSQCVDAAAQLKPLFPIHKVSRSPLIAKRL